MARKIDEDCCVSCGACDEVCPAYAVKQGFATYEIDPDLCNDCGACERACPEGCISGESGGLFGFLF